MARSHGGQCRPSHGGRRVLYRTRRESGRALAIPRCALVVAGARAEDGSIAAVLLVIWQQRAANPLEVRQDPPLSPIHSLARYNSNYTNSMKTAISLPDDLFRSAEKAARQLQLSRSQLYAAALSEFLERRRSASITSRLNQVYAEAASAVDPVLQSAQFKSLGKESW